MVSSPHFRTPQISDCQEELFSWGSPERNWSLCLRAIRARLY